MAHFTAACFLSVVASLLCATSSDFAADVEQPARAHAGAARAGAASGFAADVASKVRALHRVR
jgi:hypothetical protein